MLTFDFIFKFKVTSQVFTRLRCHLVITYLWCLINVVKVLFYFCISLPVCIGHKSAMLARVALVMYGMFVSVLC